MKIASATLACLLLAGCNPAETQVATETKARTFLTRYTPEVSYTVSCALNRNLSDWWVPCNAVAENPHRVVSILCNISSEFCFISGSIL